MQIENEYSAVERAYKEDGVNYIKWAAKLVDSMNLGIPWVMCKQNNAPDPMVSHLPNTLNDVYNKIIKNLFDQKINQEP